MIGWVQIYGITTPQDARIAEAAGVSAIGLVIADGDPRKIRLDTAAEIARQVSTPIEVLVDQPSEDQLRQIALMIEPARLQVRGALPRHADYLGPWYRAYDVNERSALSQLREHAGDRFVARHAPVQRTGFRQRDNSFLKEAGRLGAMILDGDLLGDNLSDLLRSSRAFGVQFNASIESDVGVKDAQRLSARLRSVGWSGR